MNAQHTPVPMVVDSNTAELPFRVYSKTTQGNVAFFYSEADANKFAAADELLKALEPFAVWLKHPHLPVMATIRPEEWDAVAAAYAKASGQA